MSSIVKTSSGAFYVSKMSKFNKKKIPRSKSWQDLQQEPSHPHRQLFRWGFWRLKRSFFLVFSIALLAFTIVFVVIGYSRGLIVPGLGTRLETVYFKTDGVLDVEWLQLQLPPLGGTTLAEIDIFELKNELLVNPQVREAVVERVLPDNLRITLYEYYPMAKITGRFPDGITRKLMVSQEGIVFEGLGFKEAFIKMLPSLTGVTLLQNSQGILQIHGFEQVSDLILKAREIYYKEFRNWKSIDLSSFDGKGEMPWNMITVNSLRSCKIIFSTSNFTSQLNRLKKVIEIIDSPVNQLQIDLSLGKNVYVKGLDPSQIRKLTP